MCPPCTQLCWEGEANWVNTSGQPVRVISSVLDYLVHRGRTWVWLGLGRTLVMWWPL